MVEEDDEQRRQALINRPQFEPQDRYPCSSPTCKDSFTSHDLANRVFVIDARLYCPKCAKEVATGMQKYIFSLGGNQEIAAYYKNIAEKTEWARRRELAEDAQVDEVVEFEDFDKMTKLMKDPGGAMQTKTLRHVMYDNLQKANEKARQKKIIIARK